MFNKKELESLKNYNGYYFGCVDRPGHYVFCTDTALLKSGDRLAHWISMMDGKLTPRFTSKEGVALLHNFDGFTILAFCDCSVDQRSGSNSMFIFPGELNFDQIMLLANEYFPKIMERFVFNIRLATRPVI